MAVRLLVTDAVLVEVVVEEVVVPNGSLKVAVVIEVLA